MKRNESKVLTENPLLDEIIWNAKMLARGVVLKDQDEADKYETTLSIRKGDLLIAINDKVPIQFDRFTYGEDVLSRIPNLTTQQIEDYSKRNGLIPESLRHLVTKIACDQFIENYEEDNNYYRRLHGDPDIGWDGLYIDRNSISENSSTSKVVLYPDNDVTRNWIPIHKLPLGSIEILYENGTIDNIFKDSAFLSESNLVKKNILYLNYMGSKSIDYYTARKAGKFEILFCPTADSIEVENRFKEILNANRVMTMYGIYSEGYKFRSDYYDKFIIIMIILQTVVDMMVELPEYYIRRDIFDLRTCEYIFESNGVQYFPDIPIKYQISLIKNLNSLLKFKSTDKCIIDICSIFGCKNIEIFKYYILRDRKLNGDVDANYYDEINTRVDTLGNTIETENTDINYNLKFVKVPLLKSYDDYIRSETNIKSYDEITGGDDYWNGDKTKREVESEIKELDFTLLRSKYYSVEALVDITQRTFQLVYFTNILMYNHVDKSSLKVALPNISTRKKFELVDVIITLYALSYIYYGAEDDIQHNQRNILSILGFNFEADLSSIASHIIENWSHIKVEDTEIQNFIIPDSNGILTYNQLENIYTNNKKIYDHVVTQMVHATNKEVYSAYKYIYDSLFIMRFNQDYFKKPDGTMYTTYSDFLFDKEQLLSAYISSFKSITSEVKRQDAVVQAIQSITTYLKDYIDQDVVSFENLFAGLPSISMDFVKHYVEEVINFFKSFKIFTHDMSLTYLYNDKFKNSVIIVDSILLKYLLDKSVTVKIEDWISDFKNSISKYEKMNIIDDIWMSIDTWIQKTFSDIYRNKDNADNIAIRDLVERLSHYDVEDRLNLIDTLSIILTRFYFEEHGIIIDNIINKKYTLDKDEYVNEQIIIQLESILSKFKKNEYLNFDYDITRNTVFRKREYGASSIGDFIGKTDHSVSKYDRYTILDDYYIIPIRETY